MPRAYYNEIDPYACAVLRKRIADGLIPDGDVDERDIRLVTADEIRHYDEWHFFAGIGGAARAAWLAGTPPGVRRVSNGFPCQDISFAGKGAGLLGERSGLFFTSMRLISELDPDVTLSENVAALLSRGIDTICAEFTTDGFDVEYSIVSAADVGAPHERQRVWILAYPRSRHALAHPRTQPFARLEGDSWLTDQSTLFGGAETYGAQGERWPRAGRIVNGLAYATEPWPVDLAVTRQGQWPTPHGMSVATDGKPYDGHGNELSQAVRVAEGLSDSERSAKRIGQWPTPDAGVWNLETSPEDWERRRQSMVDKGYNGNGGQPRLPVAVKMEQQGQWPTPMADDMSNVNGESRQRALLDGSTRAGLPAAVQLEQQGRWPTPGAQDAKHRDTPHTVAGRKANGKQISVEAEVVWQEMRARQERERWPTPVAHDATHPSRKTDGPRGYSANLPETVRDVEAKQWPTPMLAENSEQWPTPCHQDHKNSTLPPSQIDRDTLPGAVLRGATEDAKQWPTPVERDAAGSRRTTARTDAWQSNPGTMLTDAAIIETGEWDGKPIKDAAKFGRLNPAWVATLMGYPPTWGIVNGDAIALGVREVDARASYAGGAEWPSPPAIAQREWEAPRLVPEIGAEGRKALAAFGNAWVPHCGAIAWRRGVERVLAVVP